MQKSIRRGLEKEAMYWASELDKRGFGNYVWKRLRVIASEDVGLADSNVAVQVRALYENAVDAKKGRMPGQQWASGERLFLLHAVLVLARAPKSRMVDHALMVVYEGGMKPLDMPDYALDKHTSRGRQLGRGEEHFFEEGALLVNETLPDLYANDGRRARSTGKSAAPTLDEELTLVAIDERSKSTAGPRRRR